MSGFEFVTEGFSEFVLKYTVDFEYEIDGQVFQFSMEGDTFMTVDELFEKLGIDGRVDSRNIENVTFTSPELVRVTKITEDTEILLPGATGDGEDELWTTDDPEEKPDVEKAADRVTIKAGNWLLESLEPFRSDEELTITFKDGKTITIKVTDAQYGAGNIEIADDGTVKLTDLATISAACTSNTSEVSWDATLEFLLKYVFTENGVDAVTGFVARNQISPKIVYDFSPVFEGTGLDSADAGSIYLSTGTKTVGKLDISEDGKAVFTFTDLSWLESRNSLRGTFTMDIKLDKETAKEKGEDHVVFPGSSDGIDITYKKSVSNSTKRLDGAAVKNEDGSYTMNYTASVSVNSAIDSLVFTDTMDGLQELVPGSVRINGTAVTEVNVENNNQKFSFDAGNYISKNTDNKIPVGTYSVTYSTTISAEDMKQIEEGKSTSGNNTSVWKADGVNVDPPGTAHYEITKPVTPVPVRKTVDKDRIDMTNGSGGETVSYTVTFGDENTVLSKLQIADDITDVFTDYSLITLTYGDTTMTLSASEAAGDNTYSTGMVRLFDYTFPENTEGYGPVKVTYSAKVIDANTARRNNIFESVSVYNTAQEKRTNKKATVTTIVEYPEKPDIYLDKTASISDEDKNEDGTLKDEARITYTITIGDGNTDLSDLYIFDTMSRLQTADWSTAQIRIGNGAPQSLTDYITAAGGWYNNNWNTDGASGVLFDFTIPAGQNNTGVRGPIVITYTTKVLGKEDANAKDVWGIRDVNNTVSGGGKSSADGGKKDYGEKPVFPVDKHSDYTVKNEDSASIDPGDTIQYEVTYGGEGWELDGTNILDEMSDIQKLFGEVKVTLDQALLRDITWPDGTTWSAGQDTFIMPKGSSQWANDGVVWDDFFDDGRYSLNEWARVYNLKLPDGRGEKNLFFATGTVMTVTYSTKVISQEEALKNSIIGLRNASNKTTANHQTKQTNVPVKFEDKVEHHPTVKKEFDHWDFDNHMAYWKIIVSADASTNSVYPLKDVTVYESTDYREVWVQNATQQMYYQAITAEAFDMANAVVRTASGVVLQPGEDYTVEKGEGNNKAPSFHFEELNEAVEIVVGYSLGDQFILDGTTVHNSVWVNDKSQHCQG